VSVPDVAAMTVRALNDPRLEDKEIRIDADRVTQNELVELGQDMSGRSVKRVAVAAADVEWIIDAARAPDERMILALAQIHRSMWIRGEAVKRSPTAMDAADLYPDLRFQTVKEGLTTLL
jgi:phenylcoumaran benzylic ether reductase